MLTKDLAIQCFKDEAEAVLGLISQLDDNFEQAVTLMYECKGKVIVTGVGKSGHIGAKIAATLSSTGTPSFFINPLDVFHGDLGVMTPDDVVLVHDDLLATGGTANAAVKLVRFFHPKQVYASFIIYLKDFGSKAKFPPEVPVKTILDLAGA